MHLLLANNSASNIVSFASDFQSIATVSVGSGGNSTISFNSIPDIYKHLQIRFHARSNRQNSATDTVVFRVSNDTNSSNYAMHSVYGDRASALAFAETSSAPNQFGGMRTTTITGSLAANDYFGSGVIDIYDYLNTNKKKTIRTIGGYHHTTYAQSEMYSGIYLANNNAISSITLAPYAGTLFVQYSHFALYGIMG